MPNGYCLYTLLGNVFIMKYRVRNIDGKFYPERYDDCLGWVGYKVYADFLNFDTEKEAWEHINKYPNTLNVSCD